MPKPPPQLDVLVLGQHPCAYLAASLLVAKPALVVAHATIPGETAPDRLELLNPAFFALHKPLAKIKKKLVTTALHGVTFISDDATTRGEWRAKSSIAGVVHYSDIRREMALVAKDAGAKLYQPKTLSILRINEHGFEVALDQQILRPKALLLAGAVSAELAKSIGLPESFATEVMRKYSFIRLRGGKWADAGVNLGAKPILPMSLDLAGKQGWAWMLPGDGEVQLAVEQPASGAARVAPETLLTAWVETLRKHGMFQSSEAIPVNEIESIDLPAAGALTREIIANRTLLFGPAGGFYSACLEDLYPNCWSAVFAADAVRKALQERHLQDALQPYRQAWGGTLGEYLRGPQQNLRFLLPLVYRNPVMTSRMAESILLGKSVVR